MVNKYLLIVILLICLVVPAFALPTTVAATSVTSNSAYVSMTGGVAPMWFKYGQVSGSLTWTTPNSSYPNYTISGSPLLGNTKFYYKACDSTGCGSETFFTTSVITPQPQTTFGASIDNITRNPANIEVFGFESIRAYFWAVPTFPTIVWGLLFFGIYLGLWMRERDLLVPVMLGLITGSFIMYGNSGLSLGIPLEFQAAAQGITYAALAGIILSLIKRS